MPIFWTRLPAVIRGEWQTEIDKSLEAGQSPVLDLGGNAHLLGSLPVLAALRAFVTHRVDVTAPIIVAGGNPGLWLALLMQARSPELLRRSPDPTVVFAGADLVTYLASLTTLMPERPSESARTPNATPPCLAPLFVPDQPARAALPWESLPFVAREDDSAYETAHRMGVTSTERWTNEQWTNWIAIAVAVGLILAALVT